MRHVEDSINAQGLLRIEANYGHLHANQYVRVGRTDMMTSNECSCMSQDPAQRTKQLTDFVRINIEFVRLQLVEASFGRNVQVIDCALNQVVLHMPWVTETRRRAIVPVRVCVCVCVCVCAG